MYVYVGIRMDIYLHYSCIVFFSKKYDKQNSIWYDFNNASLRLLHFSVYSQLQKKGSERVSSMGRDYSLKFMSR